jgi:hypothetical protein
VKRALGLALLPLLASCAARDTLTIAPPWRDDEVGLLVAHDELGRALLKEPLRIEGGSPIRLELDTEGPFRIWAELYAPGQESGLSAACTISFDAGADLGLGRRFASGPIDPADPALNELAPTDEARPVPFKASCPAICERVRLEPRRVDGNSDLSGVAILGPDRYLLGGVSEGAEPVDRVSVLGILDGEVFAALPVGRISGRIQELAMTDAGGWGYSDDGQLFRLDPRGGIRFVSDKGFTQQLALDRRDGSAYAIDRSGSVIRVTDTATNGIALGGRTGMIRLDAVGPDVFAHDGAHLERLGPNGWTAEDVPADGLAEGWITTTGDRTAVFGPRGVLIRIGDAPWMEVGSSSMKNLGIWWGKRLLTVDEINHLAIWDDGEWCSLDFSTSANLAGFAISDDEKHAIIAGTNGSAMGGPLIVQLWLD